jgi:translation initiation factor 1 (eIF-1/SUI1)
MPIKQKLSSAKNAVARNRVKILGTIAVVSTTVVLIQGRNIKMFNKFLDEKGLTEEYYFLNEE